MRYLPSRKKRIGGVLLENALILPVLILFLLGLVVGGLGVFRYQQTVTLAREGARWASVHGMYYQIDEKGTAATQDDVTNNAILPLAAGMDTASLQCSVTWPTPGQNYPDYIDFSTTPILNRKSTVQVRVDYHWIPEVSINFGVLGAMDFGGVTLSSTSTMPMQY